MIFVVLAAVVTLPTVRGVDVETSQMVYGKYFSQKNGQKDTVDNSYFLFKPKAYDASVNGKLPIIIEIHGGGFTGGSPQKTPTPMIEDAVGRGIAYVSVGYRLVETKYYYTKDGQTQTEELIHVDDEGHLSLDTSGKTMDNYQVRRGRQEFMTKCAYDTAQMIEHLIAHADEYGVDVQRISTTGMSAGGGEIHYLTWVYHQWNVGRYTPRGMVYTMAQLNYPVNNMMDIGWKLWTDDVGEATKLSAILDKNSCSQIIGNPDCGSTNRDSDYNACNKSYHDEVTAKFCGDNFDTATLGEVRDTCVWPVEDPEVGKGMEVLWHTSQNMQRHHPKPFYLYVANKLNGTVAMNVVHNALYARNYAKYAEMAGINYTVYYTDYHGMTDDDAGNKRFEVEARTRWGSVETQVFNYRSSHRWTDQVQGVDHVSREEQLQYHCLALGVNCSSPSPAPSPSPSSLSDSCKREIDSVCPVGVTCQDCIRQHGPLFWMKAGCPRGRRAADECVAYCNSRGAGAAVFV